MRAIWLVLVIALGCGGSRTSGTVPSAAASAFPAARWVPGQPTYVFSAKTYREAQLAFREVVDVLGLVGDFDAQQAGAGLQMILGVDPLNADAVAGIGVDVEGSMVLFSEDVDPTFVVRVASQESLTAFFDRQRQAGLQTQSVVLDGVEVFTAKVYADVFVSWAVDKEWLWLHLVIGKGPDTAWFEHSRKPSGGDWVRDWDWAKQKSQPESDVVGFMKLRPILAAVATRQPEAAACARLVEPVERAAVAADSDGKRARGKMTVEIGGSAQALGSHVLVPPAGWAATANSAPLAAQWNLDLKVAASWIQPCIGKYDDRGNLVGGGPNLGAIVDQYGVRAGRAQLHSLDPDDKEGTGALALDLSHSGYFKSLLDEIPMRTKFERSRKFGPYNGKHLSVPFVASGDYVLDDRVFLAAMGDGLLDKVAAGSAPPPPPILAVDIAPHGLPVDVWQFLFEQIDAPSPKRLAQRLQAWNAMHVGAQLEGSALVIDASGVRR